MKNSLWFALAVGLTGTPVMAGELILRGPVPNWLPEAVPHLSNRPDDPSQHTRYELLEDHTRAFGNHVETYARIRIRVLSPLGLQEASQMGIVWNPALQAPTVHHARIIREGQPIDILEKTDFTILRREAALERSLQINGQLTGVLVNPDIRIGDTIDFAYSVRTQFDLFGNPLEILGAPDTSIPVDQAVTTVSWPANMKVQTLTGQQTVLPPITEVSGFKVLTQRITDTEGESFPENIAPRSLPDYGWQVSSTPQWGSIADRLRAAYDEASSLPDAPDIAAHVARIRAEHATPETRAMAALRLVQDEVRYMALTLGEGGWLPQSASEVWAGRQGDCKGKTVLLIALLRALDIEAIPVLVSSQNLPLDKYLPMVSAFDHVIVKARIKGETYLLDGARIGDRSLTPDRPLVHEYVLPLVERARLETIPLRLPPRPTGGSRLEIDYSDGVFSPARVTMSEISRGHRATEMQAGVATVSKADLNRMFDERWRNFLKDHGEVSELKSEWTYNKESHEFIASTTARVAFDWSEGAVDIPLAHVTWQGFKPHQGERFEDADHGKSFPNWSSFHTTIIMPPGEAVLEASVEPYEVEAGATRYFRTVRREGNRLEIDRGSINLRPYATAEEIKTEQAGMDSFKDLKARLKLNRGYSLTQADRQTLNSASASDPEVALRRGYVLSNEGDHEGAIAQFDAAIASFSSPHANALANRAMAYLGLNRLDEARADIAAAEAADPNEAILFHAKGRMAEIEGDDLEAVLAYTGALRSWPENSHALYQRAEAYERMGQSARALADLDQVIVLRPQDPEAKLARASQLMTMGRADQAYEQVDQIARDLGHPGAKVMLFIDQAQRTARKLAATDPAKAEKVLTDVLALETDFPAVLIDRSHLRDIQGNNRGAAADRAEFTRLTSIRPGEAAETCLSERIASHSRGYAATQCEKALEEGADGIELRLKLGQLLDRLGEADDALTAYRAATDHDPSSQKARYGLGLLLSETGKSDEGEALMASALSADPKADEDFARNRVTVMRASAPD